MQLGRGWWEGEQVGVLLVLAPALGEAGSVCGGPCICPLLSPASWKEFAAGIPLCLDVDSVEDLDKNIKFSFTKGALFANRSKAS